MKKIMVMLVCTFLVGMVSCGTTDNKDSEGEFNYNISKLDVDLGLAENENADLHYCDGTQMVFSISVSSYPDNLNNDNRIVIYNMNDKSIEKEFVIGKGSMCSDATIYKDRLLYFSCSAANENADMVDWKLICQSDNETKIMDQGISYNVPAQEFQYEGDALYYSFSNNGKSGINVMDDNDVTNVVSEDADGISLLKSYNETIYYISNVGGERTLKIIKKDGSRGELGLDSGVVGVNVVNDKDIIYYTNQTSGIDMTIINMESGEKKTESLEIDEPTLVAIDNYVIMQDKNTNKYYMKVDTDTDEANLKSLDVDASMEYQFGLTNSVVVDKNTIIFAIASSTGNLQSYYMFEKK